MAQFEATMSPESDRLVASLVGECDLSVRDEMTKALLAAVERSPVVAVDLAGVGFLDSSGPDGCGRRQLPRTCSTCSTP
jgi:anti-sigma B factor antagonist